MARKIVGPYDFGKYDFRQYADGSVWELYDGEDFAVTARTVEGNARRWARENKLDVESKVIEATPSAPARVALRFTKPTVQAIRDPKAGGQ